MSERKQYDDGLIRVGLLLANKRKSLGEPYQTREAFIDLRSVELFDGEPWISIRHLANIESGKNWISIEKLFALAIALEEDPVDLFEEIIGLGRSGHNSYHIAFPEDKITPGNQHLIISGDHTYQYIAF